MKINRILVPVDFSEHSLRALDYAIDLAREHGSEVVLVHAVEPLAYGIGRWSEPTKLLEEWQANAAQELAEVEKRVLQHYPKCRSEIHFGIVHEVVADLVRKLKADLIVVSTHGRTGLDHMIMGSVAEKLVRYSPCPVLTVRAKLKPQRSRERRSGRGAKRA